MKKGALKRFYEEGVAKSASYRLEGEGISGQKMGDLLEWAETEDR